MYLYTSRSDREALVHHHAIRIPKPCRVISRFLSESGRVFRSEDGEQKKHHPVDDELELFPRFPIAPILPL